MLRLDDTGDLVNQGITGKQFHKIPFSTHVRRLYLRPSSRSNQGGTYQTYACPAVYLLYTSRCWTAYATAEVRHETPSLS